MHQSIMNILFISQAEKDSAITKAFVELLYNIGMTEKNMFCSSVSEIGVPIKENIYDYLRDLLDSDNVIPVFMLSSNFYESAACLNEMGAVWMKQKEYYTFLLPGFEFKEIRGAIRPDHYAVKLDNSRKQIKNDLTKFKNELRRIFKLRDIPEQRWEECRDRFVDFLISTRGSEKICIDINESQVFCIGDVNHNACSLTVDEATNKISFQFDFYKTSAILCSMVLFLGGINLQEEFKMGKKLEFELKASNKVKEVMVEMHLSTMNPSQTVAVANEWQKYSIPLSKFTKLEGLWEVCKEICFVVDKTAVKSGTIEVKNIAIT